MEEKTKEISPVKARLKEFIATLPISEREFCRQIGVSSAYIESIKNSVSPKVMQTISIQYPQLNPLWLLMGKGEMLVSGGSAPAETAPSVMLQKLLDAATEEKTRLLNIIESQQRTIETLTTELKKVNAPMEGAAGSAAAV